MNTNNQSWAATVAKLQQEQLEWLRGIDPELPKQLAIAKIGDCYTEEELR